MISKFKTPSVAMLVAAVSLLLVVGIVSLSGPMWSVKTPPEVVEEAFELMQEEPQNLEALKPYLLEETRGN